MFETNGGSPLISVVWMLIFLITSFFYSSSGMGGASAFLAYFSIMGIPYEIIPSSALFLSVFSSAITTFNWIKAGYFRKINIAIVLSSSPFAFLGGIVRIEEETFNIAVSLTLISVGILMLLRKSGEKGENDVRPQESNPDKRESAKKLFILFLLSCALGFFGGLIGIGCGVFLFPLVYLLGIMNEKESATAGAFFILINSIFGLAGHITKSSFHLGFALKFLFPVAVGAFFGSRLSSRKFSQNTVRIIFSIVIISIGVIKLVM